MIEKVVASGAVCAEAFDDPQDAGLLPGEESIVARAVDKRRREFATVRTLARRALSHLGEEPVAILRGEKGEPLWPRGVVGSLTHCDGYRAAVVGHKLRIRSVGIDAEPHGPLPDGVLDHVSLPEEREVLARRDPGLHWDRLLFCAKEATYKTWFPLTGRWLGFEDAHIEFERADDYSGSFRSRLLVDGSVTDGGTPLTEFEGAWRVENGLIVTSITL
ncbi:4'-phosphopantetheinyl transferase family protein [Williamsia deligens]|uniref:4'-phosphopantetheinyl transferase n=1 Tax=Williamsia deligens TaxID=321325 RepID=A0ABW3GCK5_9NOCA|nr:4'-phosphopantetheinyl transferase [Williamsia deligens]MCP2195492.1 4'-phosphopantetheinyl transferase EntD (siderophore biosynthesis) [Williamsia deligens]